MTTALESRKEIAEGFTLPAKRCKYFRKHNLQGKGILHFVNELCDLLIDRKSSIPANEWDSLKRTVLLLMVEQREGTLFNYILDKHGAEAINFNSYLMFAMHNSAEVKLKIMRTMPTEIFEKHIQLRGHVLKQSRLLPFELILEAISQRDDHWGQLPSEYVTEILFN